MSHDTVLLLISDLFEGGKRLAYGARALAAAPGCATT